VDSADLVVFSSPAQFGPLPDQSGCSSYSPDRPNQIVSGWINSEAIAPVPESRIVQLDAGESLQLLGPGGKQRELQRLVPIGDAPLVFDYTTQIPYPDGSCCSDTLSGEFFESGEWTFEGSGGEDVGAFRASVRLPPFPGIELPQTVNRDEDRELSWAPEGYGESDQIFIGIGGPIQNEVNGQIQTTITTQVRCSAPAASGGITVPASLMREAVTPSGERPGMWFVSVIRPDAGTAVFSAPGIDHGTLLFTFGEYHAVNIE
jgi:hypothetical protein